jgi:hypothetical protein
VTLPPQLDANALIGVVATRLPDGRLLLTGGYRSVFTLFDPKTKAFTGPTLEPAPRSFHAAAALDAGHVVLAGGCTTAAQCAASADDSVAEVAFDASGNLVGTIVNLPGLPASSKRLGAQLFDDGFASDGTHQLLLAGGVGDPGAADVIAVSGTGATRTVTGLGAQVAALDGGALLGAFAPDGMPASGTASVLSPDASVSTIAPGPLLDGARLALVDDGTLVAFGGDAAGRIAVYNPTTNVWMQAASPGDGPAAITAPIAIGLDDGSLLVLGGSPPSARAWIYRPSLVGPHSGAATAIAADAILTPSDPSTMTRSGGQITLTSPDDQRRARALVGGPRMATGSVTAAVLVHAGGVGLIAHQATRGRALLAELVRGGPVRVIRLDNGRESVVCSGPGVDLTDRRTISLTVTTTSVIVALGGQSILTCGLTGAPELGAWGIAAVGTAAQVDVMSVAVARQ